MRKLGATLHVLTGKKCPLILLAIDLLDLIVKGILAVEIHTVSGAISEHATNVADVFPVESCHFPICDDSVFGCVY